MAKLHDIEIDDFLKQCIDLEPEAISEEFSRMSGDYGYWNEKYSAVNKAFLQAEWEEERTKARLYLKYKEPSIDGKKPPTEAGVEAAVVLDPAYEAAHLECLKYQAEREYLRGVLTALKTKSEMLVSAGAQLRQEAQGDLRMMERSAVHRAAGRFNEGAGG